MFKSFTMELAGRPLTVEVGKVAKQANGAAFMKYGDTTVLSTATASDKPRDGIDFFPLSIDYEERLYSVGKIPGGFIKREGRPSEKAILAARCIDRPIRPLFPKDYRNDVAVVATVLSVDQDCQPEIAALWGASIALSISDIPFTDPVGSVNIGLVDGELIVNPDSAQRDVSKLSLTVVSKKDKVMMIEAGASEVPNDVMMKAIRLAHDENVKIVEFIDTIVAAEGLEKQQYEEYNVNEDVYNLISEYITTPRMENAVVAEKKQETRGQHKAGYGGAQGGQHHEKPVNQLVLAQRAHRAEQDSGKHHHQGGVDADGQRKGEAVGYDLVDSQAGLGVGDAEIPARKDVRQIDDVLLPQRLIQAVLGHHGRLNFGIGHLLRGKGVAGDRFHQKECDRDDKKDGDQCGYNSFQHILEHTNSFLNRQCLPGLSRPDREYSALMCYRIL